MKTPEQVGRESWQDENTRHSVTEVARAGMLEALRWAEQHRFDGVNTIAAMIAELEKP